MSNRVLAKQARDFRASASVTDSAIFNFLSALDSPRALSVWLLYSNNEHPQLVELEVNPKHYNDARRFRDDYIATCFLSKSDFLKLEVSKKQAAMAKFSKFENQCRETNRRFKSPLSDPLYTGSNVWLLNATRRKIAWILGDYDPEEFVESANWGPGVSTLLKGENVSAYNKFQSETGITRDLYSLLSTWFSVAYPSWSDHLSSQSSENLGFTFQRGNVVVTVPKNSKTDRVIAIEPGINSWFQKAIGTMIRRRLSRVGINLNSQDKNQQFAHEGAFLDHLATVDFSSASDSVSSAVVEELLPRRWFQLMSATRSVVGLEGKQVIRWEKFSSMGNGFTFELESLIFYAAALAVCEFRQSSTADVSVFGDDVIIPASCFSLYSDFCAFLGFTVNPTKSFDVGPFRESCGAHYFEDLDCKPLYLKGRLHNVQAIFKLANGVRMLAYRYRRNSGCDRRFLFTWSHLCKRIPKHLRFGIPRGLGDIGLIKNFDEVVPPLAPGRGFEGFLVRGLLETGISRECEGHGLVLDRVRGARGASPIMDKSLNSEDRVQGNSYVLRGRTRLSVSTVLVASWYNLGGWT